MYTLQQADALEPNKMQPTGFIVILYRQRYIMGYARASNRIIDVEQKTYDFNIIFRTTLKRADTCKKLFTNTPRRDIIIYFDSLVTAVYAKQKKKKRNKIILFEHVLFYIVTTLRRVLPLFGVIKTRTRKKKTTKR